MVRIYGAQDRPRVLAVGLSDEDLAFLVKSVPTVRAISRFGEIRQAEWDALVVRGDVARNTEKHVFVLAIGGEHLGRSNMSEEYTYSTSDIALIAASVARELEIPEGLPIDIETLSRSDLLPRALAEERHQVFAIASAKIIEGYEVPSISPFLRTTERRALAGWFIRSGGESECWALPPYADLTKWFPAAIRHWRRRAPDRFPVPIAEDRTWAAFETELLLKERDALLETRQRTTLEFDRREVELERLLHEALAQSAQNEGRLLTAQGDQLVQAVMDALRELKFEIRNMDTVWPAGDRREDLRIRIPLVSQWEAMAEVKGYGGGGQLTDLMKLQRFVQRYERDEGHRPSACWYICNQLIGRHLSERRPLLQSNHAEVESFREESTLALIDTSELFLLLKRVRSSELSADVARSHLFRLSDSLSAAAVQRG